MRFYWLINFVNSFALIRHGILIRHFSIPKGHFLAFNRHFSNFIMHFRYPIRLFFTFIRQIIDAYPLLGFGEGFRREPDSYAASLTTSPTPGTPIRWMVRTSFFVRLD